VLYFPASIPQQEKALSSRSYFFVVNCVTIHKKELTSSLQKEAVLWDSLLD